MTNWDERSRIIQTFRITTNAIHSLSIRELVSRQPRRRVALFENRSEDRDAREIAVDAGNSQHRSVSIRQERIDMYTTSGSGRSIRFRSTRIR